MPVLRRRRRGTQKQNELFGAVGMAIVAPHAEPVKGLRLRLRSRARAGRLFVPQAPDQGAERLPAAFSSRYLLIASPMSTPFMLTFMDEHGSRKIVVWASRWGS